MSQTFINSLDHIRMAAGKTPGMRVVDVVFRNADVDIATTPETISPIGGLVALRSAAAVVEVVSDSAADDTGGTGAITIRIDGLNASYNEVSETLTLNGVAAVAGAVSFLRINNVVVTSAGTGKTNAGNITIRDASAGTTRSYIAASRGVSEVGVFTVPAGHQMIAQGWMVAAHIPTSQGSSYADVEFWTTKDGVRKISWTASVAGTLSADFTLPHVFSEKTDIEVVVGAVMSNDTLVMFHGHGILVGPNADF